VEGVTVKRARSSLASKIVLTALWLNFAAFWYRVYHLTSISDAFGSFLSVAVLISAYGFVVGCWIIHNLRIHRKKGPRRGARIVPFVATHDSLHRYISTRADLRHCQEIIVDVVGERKVFIAATTPLPEHLVYTGMTDGQSDAPSSTHALR
jgi:hypothetical protein